MEQADVTPLPVLTEDAMIQLVTDTRSVVRQASVTCAVCTRWCPVEDTVCMAVDDLRRDVLRLQQVIGRQYVGSVPLGDLYSIAGRGPGDVVRNLLLYHSAYDASTDTIRVCNDCQCIRSSRCLAPPRLSLANGNVCGRVPDTLWPDARVCAQELGVVVADDDVNDNDPPTTAEWRLLSLVETSVYVVCAHPGAQMALTGLGYFYQVNVNEIAQSLPRMSPSIFVIFAGSLVTLDRARTMPMFRVRRSKVVLLACWLKRNNHLYADVHIGEGVHLPVNGVMAEVVEDVATHGNVAQPDTGHSTGGAAAHSGIVNHGVFDQQGTSLLDSFRHMIRRSGDFAPLNDDNLLAQANPVVFPYGQGSYGSNRPIVISMDALFALFLRRADIKIPTPMLAAMYSILVKRHCFASSSLHACSADMTGLTRPVVERLVEVLDQQRRDAAIGRTPRPIPPADPAYRLATAARQVSGTIPNTSESASLMQQQIMSYIAYGSDGHPQQGR